MTLAFTLSVWVDGRVGVSDGFLTEAAGEQRTRGATTPGSLDESATDQQQSPTEGSPHLAVGTAAAIHDTPTSVQPLSREFGGRGEGGHETILVTVGYILIFHG